MVVLARAAAGLVNASTSPPGGLDPSQVPMFVLFTHDDAVTEATHEAMRAVTDGRASLDGCPAVATMFTTISGNECELMMDLFSSGYEIADHTKSHISLKGLDQDTLEDEVLGARSALAECGVPEGDIVGMRNPFLETDSNVRKLLAENGFLYDSTIISNVGSASQFSPDPSLRLWPWDMANGNPVDCSFFAGSQECSSEERLPGLWQVPVWWVTEDGSADGTPFSMDYGDGDNAYKILKANFDAAYCGNRAPMPIFIHTPWLVKDDNLKGVQKFADYALSQPNVYFVTMRQLLAWMQNPVPASQITPASLGCGTPGGAGGTPVNTFLAGAPSAAPTL
ncbi:Polysaccharide deacetylase domain-containing [Micractinium conductrix]|uniref:Polysaccharide deacetylase domain-containing n=1 Tax=Micractinium conductrix TaxID=554055 RepID=A0A2P6VG91_9CHLO|nr:Polysaccharide deacetylase domain-containing [Micractinium conductrix]|eukprot:PSC73088.1 Polysaccharide deacetylase domain-containing [Micractinium conductrix]